MPDSSAVITAPGSYSQPSIRVKLATTTRDHAWEPPCGIVFSSSKNLQHSEYHGGRDTLDKSCRSLHPNPKSNSISSAHYSGLYQLRKSASNADVSNRLESSRDNAPVPTGHNVQFSRVDPLLSASPRARSVPPECGINMRERCLPTGCREELGSTASGFESIICTDDQEGLVIDEDAQTPWRSRLAFVSTQPLRSLSSLSVECTEGTGGQDCENDQMLETGSTEDNISRKAQSLAQEVDDNPRIQIPLAYQIPVSDLQEAMSTSRSTGTSYWRYSMYKNTAGNPPSVHYCTSKATTEKIAKLFLDKEVIGFDLEWAPYAYFSNNIKKNVSLVQLACDERIALFHIARFAGNDVDDFVAPTLKKIMESPEITKVGVSVKSDCTRLRKFMGIESRGLFELSHLYKLVRFSVGNVKKIDKRLVSLATQAEDHLQLPLWKGQVRCSDWSARLNDEQLRYAASDSYAGFRLFDVLEGKRKALNPTPPRPAHAELNLPIRMANGQTVATYDDVEEEPAEAATNDSEPADAEEMARDFMNMVIEDKDEGGGAKSEAKKTSAGAACPEVALAESWITEWRSQFPDGYKPKASRPSLRAYSLWHEQGKDVSMAAELLRDPPLQNSTVASYILEAVKAEKLPYNAERLQDVLLFLPDGVRSRYKTWLKLAG